MECFVYANILLTNEGETVDTEYDLPQLKFNWKKGFKSAWLNFASIGILLTILAQIQIASAHSYVSTNGSCLNVRTGPGFDYEVIDCVCNGESLPRVVSYENGFAQLSSGNWVSGEWISNTRSYGYDHSSYSNNGVGGEYPDYFQRHHHHRHHHYHHHHHHHRHHYQGDESTEYYPGHHHQGDESTEYYPGHHHQGDESTEYYPGHHHQGYESTEYYVKHYHHHYY